MPGDDPADGLPITAELTAYILRAVQVEVANLRTELHTQYLNEAQMKNEFPTRKELERSASVRREWPIIVCAILAAAGGVTNVVLVAAGVH